MKKAHHFGFKLPGCEFRMVASIDFRALYGIKKSTTKIMQNAVYAGKSQPSSFNARYSTPPSSCICSSVKDWKRPCPLCQLHVSSLATGYDILSRRRKA